jgi:hypothetical protein
VRKIALAGLVAATLLAGMGAGSIGSAAAARAAASGAGVRQRVAAAEARARLGLGGPPRAARFASPSDDGNGFFGSPGGQISCSSPTACLWVENEPWVMALEGTKWKTISVPTSKKGQVAYYLDGVSCKTATYCLVFGGYENDQTNFTALVLLTWNGTSLAVIPVPPMPAGGIVYSIDAVSCTAVKRCVVFGTAAIGDQDSGEWAWTWNGSKWSGKFIATPASWGPDVTVWSADCFSLTSCEVTGSYEATGIMLFASWNGKKFTPQRVPAEFASNAGHDGVTDVSCVSPDSCAAVGWIGYGSFLAIWNGKRWTATNWTGPPYSSSGLSGVSCMTAANCLAVGDSSSDEDQTDAAVSFVWNGRKWRTAGVPGIGPGLQTSFDDVSCPKADRCVATGLYDNDLSALYWPLAGYWNGRSWKLTGV